MLVGSLDNCLESGYYPKIIKDITNYLFTLDLASLNNGKHAFPFLDSSDAWFVILEYETSEEFNFIPEVHKHHSDLQIILSGREKMAWCMDSGSFKPSGDYIVERDILFYQNESLHLNYFSAQKGYFYLFTPSVVHITNLIDEEACQVRKLVVKIHNKLLMEP